jgi:hypothetical protein
VKRELAEKDKELQDSSGDDDEEEGEEEEEGEGVERRRKNKRQRVVSSEADEPDPVPVFQLIAQVFQGFNQLKRERREKRTGRDRGPGELCFQVQQRSLLGVYSSILFLTQCFSSINLSRQQMTRDAAMTTMRPAEVRDARVTRTSRRRTGMGVGNPLSRRLLSGRVRGGKKKVQRIRMQGAGEIWNRLRIPRGVLRGPRVAAPPLMRSPPPPPPPPQGADGRAAEGMPGARTMGHNEV